MVDVAQRQLPVRCLAVQRQIPATSCMPSIFSVRAGLRPRVEHPRHGQDVGDASGFGMLVSGIVKASVSGVKMVKSSIVKPFSARLTQPLRSGDGPLCGDQVADPAVVAGGAPHGDIAEAADQYRIRGGVGVISSRGVA